MKYFVDTLLKRITKYYMYHNLVFIKLKFRRIWYLEGTTDLNTWGDTSHKCESIQKHLRLKTFRLKLFKIPLQPLKVRTSIKVGLGARGACLSGREGHYGFKI